MIYDYWTWKNFFNLKDIKEINKLCNKFKVEHFKDIKAQKATKIATVSGVYFKKVEQKLHNMYHQIKYINNTKFGYNLFEVPDLEILNFNTYDSKDRAEYGWHIDHSGSLTHDCKFTVLINTSEKKYEGGHFNLFFGQTIKIEAFDKPGTVLMFKSHLHHQVTPVTKGKRTTLTLFLKGPRFI